MMRNEKCLALNFGLSGRTVPIDESQCGICMRMPIAFFVRAVFESTVPNPRGPLVAVPGYKFHLVLCPRFINRVWWRLSGCFKS